MSAEAGRPQEAGKEPRALRASRAPVGIIPSDYAKSHRINSDVQPSSVPAEPPEPQDAAGEGETAVRREANTDEDSNRTEPTPKKKTRKKDKEEVAGGPGPAEPLRKPAEETGSSDEPKPRIVLTFRSEKPGLKNRNMKIISPDEKIKESRPSRPSRRCALKTLKRGPKVYDESYLFVCSPEGSDGSKSRQESESDEVADNAVSPPLKRSARRRSKEFSENVLANAIARKEKSYNETTPTRPSRRIKPTAKALANKELKMGIETQNNARLGIDKSPDDGVQTRCSTKKKTPERPAESSKTQPRRGLRTKKAKYYFIEEDMDTTEDYLSVDEINKCILETSALENKTDMKDRSQDYENKRLIKLKKKHLSKLGLQAVTAVKLVTNSNDNLTDDSTMDSTNTEAIVEHINAQKQQQEAEKEEALRAAEEKANDFIEEEEENMEEDDDDSEILSLLKQESEERNVALDPGASETSDEEFTCSRRSWDNREASGVVTRKRARREQVDESRHSDNSDDEMAECSPTGAEEGSAAVDPGECARSVAGCLCTAASNIYVAPHTLTEPVFCRAVESVNETRVGCSHLAARSMDGSYAALRRPGLRVPYILVCRLHAAQMEKHLCCPACSLFCTQGTFYRCSEGHFFHLACGLPLSLLQGASGDASGPPGCPHCGMDGEENEALNKQCHKVKIEMQCSNRPIFLPNQRLQCTPAQMSFNSAEPSDVTPIIPKDLLPPAPINLHLLRQRGEATTDYEELLTSSPEDRLCEAIVKKTDAEHLISRLISGVDLNKTLEKIDGGTFLHLAAKHGNLTALYLLHYAGCSLDTPDIFLRTPLIIAVASVVKRNRRKKIVKHKKPKQNNAINANAEVKPEVLANDEKKPEDIKIEGNDHVIEENTVVKEYSTAEDENQESQSSSSEMSRDCEKREDSEEEIVAVEEEDALRVIRYLVAAGCDVNYQGVEGITALHLAAQHGNVAACTALLESQHTRVDVRDAGGWTPLVWAAENKHPDVIRTLLRRGADACSMDSEGNSAMHWCALSGCVASMQLLLQSSPHTVNIPNSHSDTPMHVAARHDHYACVVVLLARGGRTDLKNSSEELPVDCARGETRTAISLNMQMSLVVRDKPTQYRILSSDISNGREAHPISCVNEADDALLPSDFTYVTEHVYPQYVKLDNTLATMQGCSCSATESSCGDSSSAVACACCMLGVRRWYSEGRLVQNFPFRDAPMLFECNQTCKCNILKCPNAVVSRLCRSGATFIRAQVYRYPDSRGWGLRTLVPVLRGAPIALYCGELLKTACADTRSKDQYMFAMEVKQNLLEQYEDKSILCVDAAQYGSASRFINHSCRPNLTPVRVFTHSRDVRMPTIVLFAIRNIEPLEELTFNYGDKFWSVKSKYMHCACGSPDCRYPSITTEAER